MSISTPFSELRKLFLSGEASVTDVVGEYLNAIERGKILNCYITVLKEEALEQARESDRRYKDGTNRLLEGLPLGVKDLFCTRGVRTTASSEVLSNFVPTYTATVVERLFQSGAIMLGKQNSDEFAMGSTNENSAFGKVHNPVRRGYVPGGSSGGSAASVSGGQACVAIGTDTGGSVRQPASMTGIVGFRPTYGRFSRWGIVPFASSLDQAGILARSVQDVADAYGVMAGFDPRDPTTSGMEVSSVPGSDSFDNVKIGVVEEYEDLILSKDITRVCTDVLAMLNKDCGYEMVNVEAKHSKYAQAVYHVISSGEACSNLAKYDGIRYGQSLEGCGSLHKEVRSKYFGDEVKRRILLGNHVLSSGQYSDFYEHAQKVRALIKRDLDRAFEKVDFVIHPCTPTTSFPFGFQSSIDGYRNDVLTTQSPLAGVPAISVPVGFDGEGLPIGIQITAPKFEDSNLLGFAAMVEKKMGISTSVEDKWWES